MPIVSKLIEYGITYKAVMADPRVGATVRFYCDNQWIGIGYVKKYPDCKITGPIKNAYGETMGDILKRFRKRLNKKVEKHIKKQQ